MEWFTTWLYFLVFPLTSQNGRMNLKDTKYFLNSRVFHTNPSRSSQDSDHISVFRFNLATGKLEFTGNECPRAPRIVASFFWINDGGFVYPLEAVLEPWNNHEYLLESPDWRMKQDWKLFGNETTMEYSWIVFWTCWCSSSRFYVLFFF